VQKSVLLAALQQEIRRHDFMKLGTVPQFIAHLCEDLLPPLLDKLSSGIERTTYCVDCSWHERINLEAR
jgi:hypothetical protein